jgi:hypothetical protein
MGLKALKALKSLKAFRAKAKFLWIRAKSKAIYPQNLGVNWVFGNI